MAIKSVIVAGILAVSSLAMVPDAAEAKTNVYIGIGGWGDPCWHGPYWRCYYPRRHYRFRDYPRFYDYDDDYDDYYYHQRRRISCERAKEILWNHGYKKVRAQDCSGKVYAFKARKKGHIVIVRVSSRTGRIIDVDYL